MAEVDYHVELSGIKDKLGGLETETRISKHDIKNVQQSLVGYSIRFDKFEERITTSLNKLSEQITAQNAKQERGAGFFAGVGAVIVVAGGVFMFLGKLLFSGHP